MTAHGIPIAVIQRPRDNPLLDELVAEIRGHNGAEMLPRGYAARAALRGLRDGKVVAMTLDQNASRREGVFVPFFGRPACTRDGPARIAMRTGAPVFPVFIERIGELRSPPRLRPSALSSWCRRAPTRGRPRRERGAHDRPDRGRHPQAPRPVDLDPPPLEDAAEAARLRPSPRDHAVLAGGLGVVEGAVGGVEGGGRVAVVEGDADRDGDGDAAVRARPPEAATRAMPRRSFSARAVAPARSVCGASSANSSPP